MSDQRIDELRRKAARQSEELGLTLQELRDAAPSREGREAAEDAAAWLGCVKVCLEDVYR